MQIKGIILSVITLAVVNASPITDASPATVASSVIPRSLSEAIEKKLMNDEQYDYCMTIAYDAPQGLAYYRVAEDSEAAVKSICETCM